MHSISANTEEQKAAHKTEKLRRIRHSKIAQAFFNMAYHSLFNDHKEKEFNPKSKIGIIGGGVAGLYAALCFQHLKEEKNFQELEFEILEASDRIGGRIYTHSFDEHNKNDYSDLGAMRLPSNNAPVFDLIDYVNQKLSQKGKKEDQLELTQYYLSSVKAQFKDQLPWMTRQQQKDAKATDKIYFQRETGWSFLNSEITNIETTTKEYTEEQRKLLKELHDISQLMSNIIGAIEKEFLEALQKTVEKYFKKDEAHIECHFRECFKKDDDEFNKLLKYYGQHSVYAFVTNETLVSELKTEDGKNCIPLTTNQAIQYENYFANSGSLHKNLIDDVLDDINFSYIPMKDTIWQRGPILYNGDDYQLLTIKGGLSQLIHKMVEILPENTVKLNKKVVRVESLEDKRVKVYVRKYKQGGNDQKQGWYEVEEHIYDKVIACIPNPACTNIDWNLHSDFQNQLDAFRVLSSFPLYKMGLYFNKRFWEDTELLKEGFAVIGGQCQTDLSSRRFIYPAYGYENGPNQKGTLLIYNINNDAQRWTGMSDEDTIERALDDLQIMYSNLVKDKKSFNIRDYFIGYISWSWQNNVSTGLAYFDEYTYNTLRFLVNGVDNVHFAGEYLSAHHGWILGAMQGSASAVSLIVGRKNMHTFLFPNIEELRASGKQIVPDSKGGDPTALHIERVDFDFETNE